MRDCIAVMPVYNEEGCIEAVCREWVAALAAAGDSELLVIDDGSRDGTPALLERLGATLPALRVLRQANAGHGAAVRRGYEAALEAGCRWVFQVDSDGELDPADFAKSWEARARSPFLLGRRTGRADHPLRRFFSSGHRLLLRLLFGVSLADPNIPFRLMEAGLLTRLLEYVPRGVFAPNVFLALLAARAGIDCLNVPVAHRVRASGVASIRGFRTLALALRCLGELWRFRRREYARFRLPAR
jgi:glycosyltransferase involved in cell wall biosynthesis